MSWNELVWAVKPDWLSEDSQVTPQRSWIEFDVQTSVAVEWTRNDISRTVSHLPSKTAWSPNWFGDRFEGGNTTL